MISAEEARTRVQRGAAHLDQLWPEWADHINIATLQLSSRCDCILGQLTGEYREGRKAVLPDPSFYARCCAMAQGRPRLLTSLQQAVTCGFDINASPFYRERYSDFARLQDAWIEAIADRKCRSESLVSVDAVARTAGRVTG